MTASSPRTLPGEEDVEAKRRLLRRLLDARETTPPAPDLRSELSYEHPRPSDTAFGRRVNPRLVQMLVGLGLDVEYVHGAGTVLTDRDGEHYLDFAGAYGALPFGHNPPQVWAAVAEMRASGEPSLVQPSLLGAAGDLADRLCAVAPAGLDRAWFCNSGAEAVEAALKVVRGARPDRTWVLATQNGFHGKTLGALSVTGRPRYQSPFGAPVPGYAHVPYGDLGAARDLMVERAGDVAAFVVEPIQGEGGIVPAPPGYLRGLRALCDDHDALLVVDEVQTGLGRTGTMFAVEHDGVRPDVMTVAKALGGGLVPIGAVLFSSAVASEAFDLRHTSTFGANAFCSRVGLASIDLLTRDQGALLTQVRARGDELAAGLEDLVDRHHPVTVQARGRGLLWGLELTDDPAVFERQGLLRSLADAQGLAAVVCGHLLRRHGIRVAPTFFDGTVIRVEPPLTVSRSEVRRLIAALDQSLGLLTRGDSATFFAHLLAPPANPADAVLPDLGPAPPTRLAGSPAPGTARWAFLAHPTDARSYSTFDRSLGLDGARVRGLFDRLNGCRNVETPAGMLLGACDVVSDDGTTTHGEVFALGHDARELLDMPRRDAVRLVRQAALEAVERGAGVVGLGAYTSIVTDNGTLLGDVGALVTTGNAFTVSTAVEALTRLGAEQIDVGSATCTVVGAAGNIGRACTVLLAERVGRLVLCGNPTRPQRTMSRLEALAAEVVVHLGSKAPGPHDGRLANRVNALAAAGADVSSTLSSLLATGDVVLSTSLAEALPQSPLVLLATSTPDAVVRPELPCPDAVLCDVSQPPNVGPELLAGRPDVTVVPGGLVELPGGRDLGVDFGLPPGVTYACTAETLVAAAHLEDPVLSRGDRLDLDAVRLVGTQARALGFGLHVRRGRVG